MEKRVLYPGVVFYMNIRKDHPDKCTCRDRNQNFRVCRDQRKIQDKHATQCQTNMVSDYHGIARFDEVFVLNHWCEK